MGQPGVRRPFGGARTATRFAIIPPVSGGAVRLVDGLLDLAAVVAEVEDERARAIATFQGTVPAVAKPAGDRARVGGLRRHGREGHGRGCGGHDGAA